MIVTDNHHSWAKHDICSKFHFGANQTPIGTKRVFVREQITTYATTIISIKSMMNEAQPIFFAPIPHAGISRLLSENRMLVEQVFH